MILYVNEFLTTPRGQSSISHLLPLQVEKSNKDLLHRVSRLDDENDSLKVRAACLLSMGAMSVATLLVRLKDFESL